MTNIDSSSSVQPCLGEAFFRQLCEHAGVALIGVDRTFTIRTWNRSAASLFGTSAKEILGTEVLSVFPAQHRDEVLTLLRASIDGPDVGHLDLTMRDQHGEPRELMCTFAPILDDDNKCLGASVSIRDISSQVAKLSSQHQSTKMIALAELAGNISHHFNNVLGGAITSLDFAALSGDVITMSRISKQVSETLFRATSLIKGLKTFAEGSVHDGSRAELSTVLENIQAEFEDLAKTHQVEIVIEKELSIDPLVPQGELCTMLRNIVQNALEAMPTGGQLHIHAVSTEEQFTVAVSDTGTGLDDVAKTRAFEPFWGTKEKEPNTGLVATGLGLAIVHGLAKMIGASVEINSSLGRGTRVVIQRSNCQDD